ncbi:SMP-30/gluconolactonase/LRE family protein [Rheinheimera sp. UJ51]|uniref:SMP-30/gluconolactonase/LRE family protein n=1 Tax=Rheinheimera sp. UJ51 TaxID=2892446 RepID=UPI001E4EF345|nr:SMP-30/gluconolactonase/LRE family protein [Rheinheimera sp. UJ51]MCC5452053.1 SMP-30/gluconolactonase/LRE family protein [Rheinheimera sp. UJ51]
MKRNLMAFGYFSLLLSSTLLLLTPNPIHASETTCEANGQYQFICGLASPEDLLRLPDSDWVIASGFAGKDALYLINAQSKAWRSFYPGTTPVAKQNMAMYAKCPGSPNPNAFTGHGLNVRKISKNLSMLYVVGHGEREAIEVFEIDTRQQEPLITWVGCILTPDGVAANSVTSLADGALLATLPLRDGVDINDLFTLESTGSVFRWSPGDTQFTAVKGTEMRYPNGIEVSADGKEFYVASSGDLKVMAFSNTQPARLLRSSEILPIVPDNLRWGQDGKLLTAGLKLRDTDCGNIKPNAVFEFMQFASCPRGFMAIATEPTTMSTTIMAQSAAQPQFSNVTMALEVNNELWFGTFGGDRIGVLKSSNE